MLFPIKLIFPIVGKFLCSNGMAEKCLNFQNPHTLFLEREPTNKYDPRAIKLGVHQFEQDLLVKDVVSN